MTENSVIIQRLRDASENFQIKHQIYSWRLSLLGDYTRMGGKEIKTTPSRLSQILKQTDAFPDVQVIAVREGDANHLYTWLLNLAETITFSIPGFSFPDLGDEALELFRDEYIRRRVFTDERVLSDLVRAILAFSTDGVAFFKVFPFEGKPTLRWVDTLYALWDVKSPSFHTVRFFAEQVRLVASEAEKWIGSENVAKILTKGSREGEAIVRFIEYWDEETVAFCEEGTFEVLAKYDNGMGFIPYLAMTAPIPPSCFMPYPPIISALGTQVLLTEHGKTLVNNIKSARTRMLADTSKLSDETIEYLLDNPHEVPFIKTQEGTGIENAVGFVGGAGISQADIYLYQTAVQEIVRHLRVNPFQAGAPINPRFATEAMLIGKVSGLYEKVLGSLWERTLGKIGRYIIRVGFVYDVQPFPYRYKGIFKILNVETPIQPLLEQDVECVAKVSLFESTQETLMKVNTLLGVLQFPGVLQRYPKLLDVAVQMLARALEIKEDLTPVSEPIMPEQGIMPIGGKTSATRQPEPEPEPEPGLEPEFGLPTPTL
jgi:hypothetical protein